MAVAKHNRRAAASQPGRSEEPFPNRDGAVAVRLLALAGGRRIPIVHVAASDARIERLARILWAFAPDIETTIFPPWDCLPFDRVSASARIMGLRTAALTALSQSAGRPRIVLTTTDALLQRVPPRRIWRGSILSLQRGGRLDPDAFGQSLARIGYREDDRVDEAGEFAIRGHVADLFPAGYYLPVRIEHEDGAITSIASYDPATQRRTDEFDELTIRPASEAVGEEGDAEEHAAPSGPGREHRLPELYPDLETLFDYLPDASFVLEPLEEDRRDAFLEQLRDAYESRLKLGGGDARPLSPERLYLMGDEFGSLLAARETIAFAEDRRDGEAEVPNFALAQKPLGALTGFLKEQSAAGRRTLITAASETELRNLLRRIERSAGTDIRPVGGWDEVRQAPPGSRTAMVVDLDKGFVIARDAVVVVTAFDVLGSRAQTRATGAAALLGEEEFGLGNAVIHLDHGVGLLRGLETVEAQPGRATDTIRLEFAGGATLMAPVADVGLMWRYGATADNLALDRLGGTSWPKRRAKVEAELNGAAEELARMAEERRALEAPRLVPPAGVYERFVARFPFSETADQHAAIADILRDLSSGRPMDRLVCGDVGFGKTEVALRAAAACALAGRQVAIVAPTTVLVRQHLQTFRRRFADLGIEVGHLSRLVSTKEARHVKSGLSDGRIRVVIGTHALAGKGVAFQDLGLLVVDEEQRFGATDKAKLRALGETAHVLTLTATPIPRTLQSALVGLQEVSVLATPPAERQPVRTVVTPFDDAGVREALIRERRRGGQSFVVCPRIEDIEPMAERLRVLVPELSLFVAHGKLPTAAIDDAMVRFADGEGDTLVATNIIESGLDVPRANTIIVWRADLFGLAQLHQLRGRVGRGRTRGTAYLLTEADIPEGTRKRLETLMRLDRLGSGFAISAEDLDQRGAGDLLGDTQAGHVKLIGAGLYRRLLERAFVHARGEEPPEEWTPELNIGISGRIPDNYIPEPEVRLNLYAKIARESADARSAIGLADEIEDRFGQPPEPVTNLLALERLKRRCRAAGIARIDAGRQAVALTFKTKGEDDPDIERLVESATGDLAWRNRRLVWDHRAPDGDERLQAVEALLDRLPGER